MIFKEVQAIWGSQKRMFRGHPGGPGGSRRTFKGSHLVNGEDRRVIWCFIRHNCLYAVILILSMGRVDGPRVVQETLAKLKSTDNAINALLCRFLFWGLIINTHLQLCKGWLKIPLKCSQEKSFGLMMILFHFVVLVCALFILFQRRRWSCVVCRDIDRKAVCPNHYFSKSFVYFNLAIPKRKRIMCCLQKVLTGSRASTAHISLSQSLSTSTFAFGKSPKFYTPLLYYLYCFL